ncbi:Hypothetical predicted protein [Cloeon dipterum]|uniref:C2H2-type domain-containing protein n=1 Tax=Cloeon dipterum TaxID=197152 RepID=A0A8S1D606_9INSE|nr:Hypothetical predicted protein [Cloeon dipterum]
MPTPTASTIGETPITVPTTSSAPSILQEGSSPTLTDATGTTNGPSSSVMTTTTPPPPSSAAPPPAASGSWRRRTKRAPQRLSQAAVTAAASDEEEEDTADDDRQSPAVAANHHIPQHPDESSDADVERFDGKIVYNPDGSAYIIEDSELSDDDAVDLPKLDGCIVDAHGSNVSQLPAFPQIANAFYVSRSPTGLYNALYGQAYATLMRDSKSKIVPEVPVMHSYRVYTVRDKKLEEQEKKHKTDADTQGQEEEEPTAVPIKPILMCFICKLSFGYAKSFVAHALSDHSVALLDEEKELLGQKNASAIIQCVGKEKEPLVSSLEPSCLRHRPPQRPINRPARSAS